MNTNQKVALLITLLVACGGVIFFGIRSNNNPSPVDTLRTNVEEIAAENPLRLDLSSLLGPYSVQLSTTGGSGGDVNGSAEVDARGNVRTTINEQGVENVFVYVDGVTYIRVDIDDSWIKFGGSGSDSRSPFSANDLTVGYNKEAIEELSDIQQTSSNEDCLLGMCRVYTANNTITNEEVIIKVENSSNRISEIELASVNGKQTSITYQYDQAIQTIAPPEQYKEFYTSGTDN